MVDNGDSASNFAISDNDLFLFTFVNYSTDSYNSDDHGISDTYICWFWLVKEHLYHLAQSLTMNRDLNSEWVTRQTDQSKGLSSGMLKIQMINLPSNYGTVQFTLETCGCITNVYFVIPVEYF